MGPFLFRTAYFRERSVRHAEIAHTVIPRLINTWKVSFTANATGCQVNHGLRDNSHVFFTPNLPGPQRNSCTQLYTLHSHVIVISHTADTVIELLT